MTEKRFIGRYAGRTIKKLIGIEDIETNRVCVTIEENIRLLNELSDENEQLKQQLECQQEVIVRAIDSLMDLPSASIYLLKQWLDILEDFDSIEDMKNTFFKKIKELEND